MGLIYFLVYLFLEILFSYEFAKVFTPFGLFLEVILTALTGIMIIRTLNFSMYESMQRVMRREISEEEFISIGLFKLIGAILLFIPGVFSDMVGLLLMFEPVAKWFAKKFLKSNTVYQGTHYYNDDSDIIDVEIIEEIPKKD
jgi:UPF0716 family protein affecting phage T7 exclusion